MKKMIAVLLLCAQVSNAQGLFGAKEPMTEQLARQTVYQVSKFMIMSAMSGQCAGGLNKLDRPAESMRVLMEQAEAAGMGLEDQLVSTLSDVVSMSKGQYKVALSKNARSIYPVVEIVDAETGEYKRGMIVGEDYIQCM